MKKTYIMLALSFGIFITNADAQTLLSNSDFENWTTAANGTDSLIGWSSSNSVVMPPIESLVQTTDAHHGNAAAQIITAPFGFVGYTTIGILVNGEATFSYGGGGNTDGTVHTGGGGTPIGYKPEFLNGYYKYETTAPADHGIGRVLLTRYNTSTQQRDTVSYGAINFQPQTSYTSFSIPLTDQMPSVMPDSITAIFSSSDTATVPQFGVFSTLFLDSLTLNPGGPTSIPDVDDKSSMFSIAPNPNNGLFTISNPQHNAITLGVYDAVGKRIRTIHLTKDQQALSVDMHELSAGTYFLNVEGNSSWVQMLLIIK